MGGSTSVAGSSGGALSATGGALGADGGTSSATGSCGEVELLTNGNFDGATHAPWIVQSAQAQPLFLGWADPALAEAGVSPYSLDNLVMLGLADSEVALLSQTVSVPASAISLKVSGFMRIVTNEDTSTVFDRAYAEFVGQPALLAWTNQNANTDWTAFAGSLSAVALQGQSATFRFRVTTDAGAPTSFYFDSVSVVASLCAN